MRTDRSAGADPSAQAGSDRSLARRSFLVATGALVGTPAVGSARERDDFEGVRVAATEPYRSTVRRASRALSDTAVSLRPADATRGAGVGYDVHVSGRPELAPGGDASGATLQAVEVVGRAALVDDGAGWRECLDRPRVRNRWADDAPVEAWSETGRETVAAVGGPGEDAGTFEPADVRRHERRIHLVRGRRPAQYAKGHGGVGYYDVAADEVARAPRSIGSERVTPLLKLAYVHVSQAEVDDGAAAFLRALGDAGQDDPTVFADPSAGGER